jgi:hypothetical protein
MTDSLVAIKSIRTVAIEKPHMYGIDRIRLLKDFEDAAQDISTLLDPFRGLTEKEATELRNELSMSCEPDCDDLKVLRGYYMKHKPNAGAGGAGGAGSLGGRRRVRSRSLLRSRRRSTSRRGKTHGRRP